MELSAPLKAAVHAAARAALRQPLETMASSSGIDAVYDLAPAILPFGLQEFRELDEAILEEPAFRLIAENTDPNGLYLTVDSGGTSIERHYISHGLLQAAALSVYFNGVEVDEQSLTDRSIEHCNLLVRALDERLFETESVIGLTGLAVITPINTPWGKIVTAPTPTRPYGYISRNFSPTTALLVKRELEDVTFGPRDYEALDLAQQQDALDDRIKARLLLQLAIALAAPEDSVVSPEYTFNTRILPFSSSRGASAGRTMDVMRDFLEVDENIRAGIEHWSEVLVHSYHPNLAVAARRIVASINGFRDLPDSLIDAVISWENLVGTNSETVFRVTAALAHLLEPEQSERETFRRRLARVYDTRSRLVHGETVSQSRLDEDRTTAVRVAIHAFQALLKKGNDWTALTSAERSTRLLLTG